MGGTLRELGADELDVHRAPWRAAGEGRRVMLAWVRAVPFDCEPADVHARAVPCQQWLRTSDVPKLRVRAEPGALTTVLDQRCRAFPEQVEVTGPGIHLVPEDSPDELGAALRAWLLDLPVRR